MSKRSGDDIFASSGKEEKKARKFWEKEVKRALKSATSPMKVKKIQKSLVKQYREKNPNVSKEDAKESFSAAIAGSSKFSVEGKYIKLAKKGEGGHDTATTTDVGSIPERSAPSKTKF